MKLTAKYLLVVLLACCTGAVQANYENEYMGESRGCCMSSCYECGCNPLYCGAWDLQIDGGVNPIIWHKRGNLYALDCTSGTPLTFTEIPKFNHVYKTPWIVGGQVGYHWSDNVRVYVEFNYSQARAKRLEIPTLVAGAVFTGIVDQGKYKIFDAYVGARYYWDRWCDRVAFFLGAKVGLTHHKGIHGDLSAEAFGGVLTTLLADQSLAHSNNVVSGGADFGFDVCFCGNWSFVVTGTVIASCGPRFNSDIVIPTNIITPVTNLLYGGIGTELRFPVTAGIRYSF